MPPKLTAPPEYGEYRRNGNDLVMVLYVEGDVVFVEGAKASLSGVKPRPVSVAEFVQWELVRAPVEEQ